MPQYGYTVRKLHIIYTFISKITIGLVVQYITQTLTNSHTQTYTHIHKTAGLRVAQAVGTFPIILNHTKKGKV